MEKEEVYKCCKRIYEEGDSLLGKVFERMIKYETLYNAAEKENEELRKKANNP